MWFFSKTERKNSESSNGHSTMGFLFNPRFGDDIKAASSNISAFVQLIALVFASHGLFPKNHPALNNVPNAQLTLAQVLSISYHNIPRSKIGVPKFLLFFAVIATLIFSALLVAAGLFMVSAGSHPAFAAEAAATYPTAVVAPGDSSVADLIANCHGMFTPCCHGMFTPCCHGMFTPCSGADMADQFLSYLFDPNFGNVFNFSYSPIDPPSPSRDIQDALRTTFAFYSNGILILAGIILAYHLLSIIAQTAHTGKPFGNANQIWAPIRLVVAIGLLVPISGGMNSAQAIVVQVARWGSGFASHAWTIFAGTMVDKTMTTRAPVVPFVDNLALSLMTMRACLVAYNTNLNITKGYDCQTDLQYTGSDGDVHNDPTGKSGDCIQLIPNKAKENEASNGFRLSTTWSGDTALCGKVIYPDNPAKDTTSDDDAKSSYPSTMPGKAYVNQIYKGIAGNGSVDGSSAIYNFLVTAASGEIAARVVNYGGSGKCANTPPQTALAAAAAGCVSYSDLDSASGQLAELVKQYSIDAAANVSESPVGGTGVKLAPAAVFALWTQDGWVSAGAWFNTIARLQGIITSAPANALPTVDVSGIVAKSDTTAAPNSTLAQRQPEVYEQVSQWVAAMNTKLQAQSIDDTTSYSTVTGLGLEKEPSLASSISGVLFTLINVAAKAAGAWGDSGDDSYQGISWKFTSNNPLVELVDVGHKFVHAGTTLILWGMLVKVIADVVEWVSSKLLGKFPGGFWVKKVISPLLDGIAGVIDMLGFPLMMIGGVFLTIGMTLTFILPMVPFLKFFFAVMTWLISVFEAVVAAPLFALAHLNPEGDGLPGGMARQGYFFLLAIFLRPILTFIGLFGAFLIFFLGITMLNKLFSLATSGTGVAVFTSGFETLARIFYSCFYVAMAYVCANTAFKLITFVPEHAMRWISSSGPSGLEMHDEGKFGEMMGVAGGIAGTDLVKGMASGAGKILEPMKTKARTKANAAVLKEETKQAGAKTEKDNGLANQLVGDVQGDSAANAAESKLAASSAKTSEEKSAANAETTSKLTSEKQVQKMEANLGGTKQTPSGIIIPQNPKPKKDT